MKRVLFVALCIILISGCALIQKPPDNPDEKAAWIDKSQAALDRADLGEAAAFILFGSFCASKQIDPATCAVGIAADQEWKKNYQVATGALAKYKSGEITQAEAQRLQDRALLESLKIVMAALMPANKAIQERAVKARGGDLLLPAGQSQKPVQRK